MKKQFLLSVIFSILLISLFPQVLSADVGPKPSVTVTIEGTPEAKTYYVTLLSEKEDYGPWHKISEEAEDGSSDEGFAYFANYQDKDGYCFQGQYEKLSGDGEFHWGYYPPERFKIAIYCPEDDVLYLSDPYEREEFNSYFTVQYGTSPLEVKVESHLGRDILNGLLRALATIAVEMALAYLFAFRSRSQLITIFITNMITQIFLNVFLAVTDAYGGLLVWMMMFVVGELAVLAIEELVYLVSFKKEKKWKVFLYTLLANFLTAVLTMVTTIRI